MHELQYLAKILDTLAVTIRHSEAMLDRNPWWRVRNKWELRAANGILNATYDMVYAMAVIASSDARRERGTNEHHEGSN